MWCGYALAINSSKPQLEACCSKVCCGCNIYRSKAALHLGVVENEWHVNMLTAFCQHCSVIWNHCKFLPTIPNRRCEQGLAELSDYLTANRSALNFFFFISNWPWQTQGLRYIQHDKIKSFVQISEEFGIPRQVLSVCPGPYICI